MVNPVAVTIVGIALVLALISMIVGWRRRGRAQRRYLPPVLDGDAGTERASADGLYLTTTFAGRPLDRVVAGGLGYRARARIAVTDRGVLIDRAGAVPLLLDVDRLAGAGTGTWTIDRGVEPGGLLVLRWSLDDRDGGAVDVESSFRLAARDQATIVRAVDAVLPTPPSTPEVPRDDAAA